jgi:NAD(P)-dependent dehydrogenase (short-subunit alcohol dehydrogenase family)
MSTILITGASAGLGLAITKALLSSRSNHTLILCCNTNDDALQTLASDPSNSTRIHIIKGDVSSAAFVPQILAQSLLHFNITRLDSLILNHGILGAGSRIATCPPTEWNQVFQVNFFSVAEIIRHTLPWLREARGRIILTSSGAAEKTYTTWGPYGASKAALNSLARTLAKEEKGVVTVVAVRPGMVDTGMQERIREGLVAEMDEDDREKFVGAFREGKLLPPEKPARVMAALATGAGRELSGEFLSWDDERLTGLLV